MTYGYIRVSSDKQTVENQRFEIIQFCLQNGLCVDGWIEETISGAVSYNGRRLGVLLRSVKNGDIIVCSELSRLGRNLLMIMEILNVCMERGCRVWTIKDGYRLGDDIQSKVLAFAFGMSAELERKLISQRTAEAMARLRELGVHVGRPKGKCMDQAHYKLYRQDTLFRKWLAEGMSMSQIARRFRVSRTTVLRYYHRFVEVKETDLEVKM